MDRVSRLTFRIILRTTAIFFQYLSSLFCSAIEFLMVSRRATGCRRSAAASTSPLHLHRLPDVLNGRVA